MRISGAGHEKLMVIMPMLVVFVLAMIAMGGPAPMLDVLDRRLSDFFTAAWAFVQSVV